MLACSISYLRQPVSACHSLHVIALVAADDKMDIVEQDVVLRLLKEMKLNSLLNSTCRMCDSRRWSFASSGYSTTTAGSNAVSIL